MRFNFGSSNPATKALYLLGLPLVTITFLDRLFAWQLTNEQLNMQLFLAGAIAVALGSIINISYSLYQTRKSDD